MKYIKLFFLIFVFMISSCASFRPPSFINSIPLHEKKGDKLVVASINLYGVQTSFDYAITNHIGIFYKNLSNKSKSNNNNLSGDLTYHYFNGFGAGFYENVNSRVTIEIYGGYGMGFYGSKWTSPEKYPLFNDPSVSVSEIVVNKSYYHQLLLKWDVGFRFKYFSFGIASSISRSFNYIRYNYSLEGEEDNIAKFKEKNNSSLYQPFVLFSNVGLKKFKISLQAGTFTTSLNKEFDLFGSLGLSYSF